MNAGSEHGAGRAAGPGLGPADAGVPLAARRPAWSSRSSPRTSAATRWSGTCARASPIFTLLAFRLVWGFVGGHWSRFRAFVYAPSTSLRYLRGESLPHEHHHVGHNPLGAGSVFALLGILAAPGRDRPDRRRRDRHHRAADQVRELGDEQPGDELAQELRPVDHHRPGGAAPRRDRLLLVPAPAEPGRADVARRQAAAGRRAPTRSTTAGRGRSPWRSSSSARSAVAAVVRLGG